MGNIMEKIETIVDPEVNKKGEVEDTHYITHEEREHLKEAYANIFLPTGISPLQLSKELGHPENSLFISTLISYLNIRKIQTYLEFESFVIEAVRTSPSKSLHIVWELANLVDLSTFHFNESQKEDPLIKLCLFIYEISTRTLDDIEIYVEKLREFYHTTSLKSNEDTGEIDANSLINTATIYSPFIVKAFQTYFSYELLKCYNSPSFKPFLPAHLLDNSDIIHPQILSFLSLVKEEFQGCWKRLYTTSSDGHSFNRVVHHILGYEGPTVIIIRCADPEKTIFGMYSHNRWFENNRFYGSEKNFIFTITPHFRIYQRRIPTNGNFQWLNSKVYGMPHGLGFGGTLDGFRVFINDSLEKNIALNDCPTYETGKIVPNETFEIDAMEVWGVGGDLRVNQALKAQVENRKIMAENLHKARSVDKATFFDNAFDREFLLSKTFSYKKDGIERPDA